MCIATIIGAPNRLPDKEIRRLSSTYPAAPACEVVDPPEQERTPQERPAIDSSRDNPYRNPYREDGDPPVAGEWEYGRRESGFSVW